MKAFFERCLDIMGVGKYIIFIPTIRLDKNKRVCNGTDKNVDCTYFVCAIRLGDVR